MSGLINFIKGLVSTVLGFFSKKSTAASTDAPKAANKPKAVKKSGYFLELDDSNESPAPAVAPAAPVAAVVEAATEPKSTEKKPSKRAAQLAAAKAETAKEKPTTKPAEPAKAPEPAVANALNLPKPTVTTFAPNYLMPASSNGRRRPGANMSPFLDMAKQVKVPNRA